MECLTAKQSEYHEISEQLRNMTCPLPQFVLVEDKKSNECGKRQQVNRLNGYKYITIQVVKIIA